ETHGVVGVPEQHDLIAESKSRQLLVDAADGLTRLPFFGHDDGQVAVLYDRPHEVLHDKAWGRSSEVGHFALLAVVDATRMKPADPLTPAMQYQVSVHALLTPRQVWSADKHEINCCTLR